MTMPPPPATPPHQPAQPAQPAGPTGWIDLTIQGSMLTSNMIAPTVLLNGHHMPTRYGQNVYPVPPGRWQMDVSCQWLMKYGQASLTMDVTEGQTVPVFYASPYHQFSKGAIGHEKQKRPGLVGLLVLILVIVVVVGGIAVLGAL